MQKQELTRLQNSCAGIREQQGERELENLQSPISNLRSPPWISKRRNKLPLLELRFRSRTPPSQERQRPAAPLWQQCAVDPPVPIPNTEVKGGSANDSAM